MSESIDHKSEGRNWVRMIDFTWIIMENNNNNSQHMARNWSGMKIKVTSQVLLINLLDPYPLEIVEYSVMNKFITESGSAW